VVLFILPSKFSRIHLQFSGKTVILTVLCPLVWTQTAIVCRPEDGRLATRTSNKIPFFRGTAIAPVGEKPETKEKRQDYYEY
jgi:hypothetical protein